MMTDGFLFRAGLLFITKYDEKLIKEGKRIHFNQAYLDDFNKNDVPKNNIVIFNFEADDLEAEWEHVIKMNTTELKTERLILRKFTRNDLEALYKIFSDEEVNRFLPWFPLKTISDAEQFFEKQFQSRYDAGQVYNYAVCLERDNYPVGYINVSMDAAYDFGYGLRKEFWHRGIITEAGKAVITQLKKDGISYITATHDINNPRSGIVMKRLGMKYQYSYEEQWQPKNFLVTFRMYQLNLDGNDSRIYREYWDRSTVHFVEPGLKKVRGTRMR